MLSGQLDESAVQGDLPALVDEGESQYGSDVEPALEVPTLPAEVSQRRLSSVKQSNVITDKDSIRVNLQADDTVTFVGQYDLEVLRGNVLISGALLRPGSKKHRIFAPSTHALPVITAKGGVAEILAHSTTQPLRGLAKLSPLYGRLWNDQLEQPQVNGAMQPRSFTLLRTSGDDGLQRPLVALEVEVEAQRALNKMMSTKPLPGASAPVIMVTGPKGSGKSTFCRTLTNTILTAPKPNTNKSCFWLDLDPGQPEFSCPGQVSLCQLREPIFGPPFTHPFAHPAIATRLVRSHTLAAISPKDDTDHLLACALDLYDHYSRLQAQHPGAPLIVNCSGWVLGSALAVLYSLIQRLPLNDLVLMQPMDLEAVQYLNSALSPNATLWSIPVRVRPPQTRTSAEFRAMQAMSYLHSIKPTDSLSSWDPNPLSAMRPWQVSYAGSTSGTSAILCYHEPVPSGMYSTVLDGQTVAVVQIESDAAFASHLHPTTSAFTQSAATEPNHSTHAPNTFADLVQHDERTNIPFIPSTPSGLLPPLDPRHSHCLGTALIRGIDTANHEFHLLTPIPASILRAASRDTKIVLVRGKFDSPDWAFLEDVYYKRSTTHREDEDVDSDESDESDRDAENGGTTRVGERPYIGVRTAGAGLSGSVWRVRHLPRKMGGGGGDAGT